MEAQIKQGFFENRAAQLSFWERGYLLKRTGGLYVTPYIHDASTFAFTSDDGDQAVVLGIYYNQAKARSDGNFGTKYLLPGEGDERVYPIAVYGVDPEYIEAMKPENRHQYMLSLRERLRRVHEIASQRWPKSDLIPRN
ncbi:MAG: hypothetical protein KGQ49_01030 [Verrucomicrobia bacterium]|nr:hypothetical protein [Verrucomicrobiota bacterium]MDE3047669.1 hypothetical protein [Verrucomicrobiota bacterium]